MSRAQRELELLSASANAWPKGTTKPKVALSGVVQVQIHTEWFRNGKTGAD